MGTRGRGTWRTSGAQAQARESWGEWIEENEREREREEEKGGFGVIFSRIC